MPVKCPKCGREHDAAQFHRDEKIRCQCGFSLDMSYMETVGDFLRFFESEEERERAQEVQQDAENICRMILDESCPDVDIEIAKNMLKEKVQKLFPDRIGTYQMIYEARFSRLWEQFRGKGPVSGPEGRDRPT